ncbi:M protein trans-acting positive regulator [Enterococcus faecalis 13-SD-W-01]|nr:M protein trans-acting positive regulator [Enterococcus faecalis 13-SD-W-01]
MEELIEDAQNSDMTNNKFHIQKRDNGYSFEGDYAHIVLYLNWIYGKQSKLFKFLHATLTNPFFNILQFSSDNYLSSSTAYKLRADLTTLLAQYNLELDHEYKIIGDAFVIHQFLYSIYFKIFNYFEFPFNSFIETEAKKLVYTIENSLDVPLSRSDFTKLSLFSAIVFLRKNYLQEDDTKSFFYNILPYDTFQSIFKNTKELHLNAAQVDTISKDYQCFLEFEHIMPYSQIVFTSDIYLEVNKCTSLILKELNFLNLKIKKRTDYDLVFSTIKNFILHSKIIEKNRVDFSFPEIYDFSKNYYFERFLIKRIQASLSALNDMLIFKQKNSQFRLALLLNKLLNYFYLEQPIKIHFDLNFNKTSIYEIIENLKKYFSLDIALSLCEFSEADICISDTPFLDKKIEKSIVYTSPFITETEYKKIADVIISIIVDKLTYTLE